MIATLGVGVWLVVKIFFIIALVIYLIFSLVVVRQVNLMIDTLEVGWENLIRSVAWGHFLFALGILVLSFIIL